MAVDHGPDLPHRLSRLRQHTAGHPGLEHGAAVGEGGIGVGQLQGRDRDLALTDGHVDVVAREPVPVGEGLGVGVMAPPAGLGIRDHPLGLGRQGHPRALAQRKGAGHVLDGAVTDGSPGPPEGRTQRVEVEVARHGDGSRQRDAAVRLTLGVAERALPHAVGQPEDAGVVVGRGRGDEALLQGGDARGQLERRTRRVLALDGAIVEGEVTGRVLEGGEGVGLDAVDEGGGVIGRVGGQSQDGAVAWIHHHDRTCGGDEVLLGVLVVGAMGHI